MCCERTGRWLPVRRICSEGEFGVPADHRVRDCPCGPVCGRAAGARGGLSRPAGIDMTHVPYKGAGATYADVLSGGVPVMFSTYAPVAGYLAAGTLRAIGVTTEKRAAGLPNVPAIAETLP